MKIVINTCYGGFGLSEEAAKRLRELGESMEYWEINRDNEKLVQVVTELGSERSSSRFAELKIIEIPYNIDWEIDEYDGLESIHEKRRVWQ